MCCEVLDLDLFTEVREFNIVVIHKAFMQTTKVCPGLSAHVGVRDTHQHTTHWSKYQHLIYPHISNHLTSVIESCLHWQVSDLDYCCMLVTAYYAAQFFPRSAKHVIYSEYTYFTECGRVNILDQAYVTNSQIYACINFVHFVLRFSQKVFAQNQFRKHRWKEHFKGFPTMYFTSLNS